MLLDCPAFVRHLSDMESSDSPAPKKLFSANPSELMMWPSGGPRPSCTCFTLEGSSKLGFHSEVQDTNCKAWKMLNDLIDTAAATNSNDFLPGHKMPPDLWSQIVTLPPSISK